MTWIPIIILRYPKTQACTGTTTIKAQLSTNYPAVLISARTIAPLMTAIGPSSFATPSSGPPVLLTMAAVHGPILPAHPSPFRNAQIAACHIRIYDGKFCTIPQPVPAEFCRLVSGCQENMIRAMDFTRYHTLALFSSLPSFPSSVARIVSASSSITRILRHPFIPPHITSLAVVFEGFNTRWFTRYHTLALFSSLPSFPSSIARIISALSSLTCIVARIISALSSLTCIVARIISASSSVTRIVSASSSLTCIIAHIVSASFVIPSSPLISLHWQLLTMNGPGYHMCPACGRDDLTVTGLSQHIAKSRNPRCHALYSQSRSRTNNKAELAIDDTEAELALDEGDYNGIYNEDEFERSASAASEHAADSDEEDFDEHLLFEPECEAAPLQPQADEDNDSNLLDDVFAFEDDELEDIQQNTRQDVEARAQGQSGFVRVPYPDPRAGRSMLHGSVDHGANVAYGAHLANDENPYHPFNSQIEWEVARWAKLRGATSTAFSDLLSINGVSEHLGLSFKNANELNKIIDYELPTGRPKFKWEQVVVVGESFDVYYRDIIECIRLKICLIMPPTRSPPFSIHLRSGITMKGKKKAAKSKDSSIEPKD
ncbi:hypothetical protein EV702DRAFT_1199136 [Suillus placidus]|uniref:Uncharacterized protein n=1 Tax=Suillus placidus TaxID=48579 RepID=A0A9P7D1K1_9AGAM|nr:hypothetical protein EV702DRAFT_1199136 [Suillus placidus]